MNPNRAKGQKPKQPQSSSTPTQTLDWMTSQSRSCDIKWLSDVFSSLSLDQIESAYTAADCDAFMAAGILGSNNENKDTVESDQCVMAMSTIAEGPSQKKSCKVRPRRLAVSSGLVSTIIGKRSRSEVNELVTKNNKEEAVMLLNSVLGEQHELRAGVVRHILGLCGGDTEKAMELLLQLSDWADHPQIREQLISGLNNSGGMRTQLGDQASQLSKHAFGKENLHCGRSNMNVQSLEPKRSKPNIEHSILESLFVLREKPQNHSNPPVTLDWRKIVTELQNDHDGGKLHSKVMPATKQTPQADGYHEFRTVAQQNWNLMKTYYQRASLEYSRGNHSHAACLSEKANYFGDLARMDDERASLEIFDARNKDISNCITIDLHGQHLKQAVALVKRHLLSLACLPSIHYLRVITGCGQDAVGKGKIKRSIKNLAIREKLDWSEENSGTIKLTIKGRKAYSFTAFDDDETTV